MNARDLPCRATGDLARYMVDQDEATRRGQRKQAWRRKRQSELECGEDVEALAVSLDVDPSEWHQEFAALCVTATADRKLLKLEEIKRRLVHVTLDREEAQWVDQ